MRKEYFPLGSLIEDRVELSKRYYLLEFVNGIYRLTEKCRKSYDEMSYLKFLKGLVDQEQVQHKNPKPITRSPETRIKKQPAKEVIKSNPDEFKDPECQQIINEILSM